MRFFGIILTNQIMNYKLLSGEEEECLIFVAAISRKSNLSANHSLMPSH